MSTELSTFKVTRSSGKSDSEILVNLIRDSEPNTVFPYSLIAEALSSDSNRVYDRRAVQCVVSRSALQLSKECQRALYCVPGVGYRVAAATEHRSIAHSRQRRADRQLAKGLAVLEHVKWDEMTQNERDAHQGQLMILQAVVSQQRSMERRMNRIEKALRQVGSKGSEAG